MGELVSLLGMSQPGVSRHLRIMREAELVDVRNDAQRRLYRARPESLMELDAWIQPYRRYWTSRLDGLDRHLAQSVRARKDNS